MLYNKAKNRKLSDKKVLHKVKKRWIVVSSALLMALGGYTAATHTPLVHADTNLNNSTSNNANLGKESVGQLTNNNGKALNLQSQSEPSNNHINTTNADNVTSQAHQLHSQILQNDVLKSNSQSNFNTTAKSPTNNLHNNSSLVVNGANQKINYDKPVDTTLNNSQHRLLGVPDKEGTITVEDVDIYNGDREVSNGIASLTGSDGKLFTKSDQEKFTKLAPAGYIFSNVISAPQKFIAGQNQLFQIAVVPRKAASDVASRIMWEYTNADNYNQIIGQVHQSWNNPGTPFNLYQWEANLPQGYILDQSDYNSNTINYQSPNHGKPTDVRHFTPSGNPAAPQPKITFVPGDQLIKIGVKRDPNDQNPDEANMMIDYMDRANGKIVQEVPTSAKQGTPFKIDSYMALSNLPDGYNNPTPGANNPTTYQNDGIVTILVTNKANTSQTDQMSINYVDSQGDSVGTPQTVIGSNGSSFSLAKYETAPYLSSDYTVSSVLNNTETFMPNHTITINVMKKALQMALMPVIYYDQGNNYQQVGATQFARGYAGTNFDVVPYITSQLPQNYSFAGFRGQVPTKYTEGQTLGILVKSDNTNSNNQNHQSQLITIPVYYQDNGQTVSDGITSTTGQENSSINIPQFRNNVPAGYTFAGLNSNDPITFTSNSQPLIINVTPKHPVQQKVPMTISYLYNGQKIGSDQVSDYPGRPFNVNNYENQIPNQYDLNHSYQYTGGSVTAPNVFMNNYDVKIDVSQVPTHNSSDNKSKLITMMINYVYNGKTEGTQQAPGIEGTIFNPLQYEQLVPTGFKATGAVSGPNVNGKMYYLNNQVINIDVEPITSNNDHHDSNQPNPQPEVNNDITVEWIDGKTGLVSDELTLPGKPGQSFPLNYYMQNAPEGTKATGKVIGQPVTKYTDSPQTVKIEVMPITVMPQSRYGTITVRCVDPSGKDMGSSDVTSHKVGTPFNLQTEMQFVHIPDNYHVVRLSNQGITQYRPGDQIINVEVAPNQPVVQNGKITLVYMDNAGNVVGPYDSFTHKVGTPFNALSSINSNMPNGYHLVQLLDGANVNQYKNGEQFVSAEVAANPQPQSQSNNNQTDQPSTNYSPNFNPTISPVFNNYPNSNSANQPSNPVNNPTSNDGSRQSTLPTNNQYPTHKSNGDLNNRITNNSSSHHTVNQDNSSVGNRPRNNTASVTRGGITNSDSGTAQQPHYGQSGITNVANQQTASTSMVQSDDMTDVSDDVTSDASVNADQSVEPSDSNDNSQLPQTGETSRDRDLAAMASILATIGASLTQLGYSLDKRRRH